MKETTLKLSGHSKDRFLERFFAEEPGLAAEVARRLAARCKVTFTSLRVRKAAVSAARRQGSTSAPAARKTAPSSAAPTSTPASVGQATAFDPYAFGLVPVFQREGRDGLVAKLGAIDRADHLRQMAKAQQIVLPQELRTGEVALEGLRAAMADAVARRIADRRAAAG